jgi:hypothetical protein
MLVANMFCFNTKVTHANNIADEVTLTGAGIKTKDCTSAAYEHYIFYYPFFSISNGS